MGLKKIARFFSRAYAGGMGLKAFGLLCSMLLLLAGGCGYDVTETTTYRAANWTTDGQIIARRLTLKHGKNLISNSIPMGSSEEIVLMNADGSGEHGLFSVDENMIMLIEMSPRGNYVGYINGDGELKIYTRGGALVGRVTLGADNSVQVLDFSPDETKVYLSFGYGEMLIYSVPDLVAIVRNRLGGGGVWKTNEKLLVYHSDLGGLGEYSLPNLTMTHLFAFSVNEMVYNSDKNTLYSLGAEAVYSYVLGGTGYETRPVSWSPYEANDFTGKHLSGDGGRVVMGDAFEYGGIGIFILDIEAGGGIVRIR